MNKTMNEFLDLELKTKHGIDKLQILVKFFPIIHDGNTSAYNKLKSFLVCALKRGIKSEEEINMCQGIINYVNSEPGTNERLSAMQYLFNLEFLL
jgi:hypothetical protein